jgi:hypothetical protein
MIYDPLETSISAFYPYTPMQNPYAPVTQAAAFCKYTQISDLYKVFQIRQLFFIIIILLYFCIITVN